MTNIQITELNPVTLTTRELEGVVGGAGWYKPVVKKPIYLSYTSLKVNKTTYFQSFNNQNAQNFNNVVQLGGYGSLNVSTNLQQAVNTIG